MLCPACSAIILQADAVTYCVRCGWLPLAEIERQLRYWSDRREQAMLEDAGVRSVVRMTP